jgi:hypothetical protein
VRSLTSAGRPGRSRSAPSGVTSTLAARRACLPRQEALLPWPALLNEQQLGGLADEPVRVEKVGVGESDADVTQVGAAHQVHPFPGRRAEQGRGHGRRDREPLLQRQRQGQPIRRVCCDQPPILARQRHAADQRQPDPGPHICRAQAVEAPAREPPLDRASLPPVVQARVEGLGCGPWRHRRRRGLLLPCCRGAVAGSDVPCPRRDGNPPVSNHAGLGQLHPPAGLGRIDASGRVADRTACAS